MRDYADPKNERFGLYKKEDGELIGIIDIVCFGKRTAARPLAMS